jgi:hypothetical protein
MTTPPSSRSRDAALRRLAHCNRWLLAGSATLTGVFTLLAAQAFPGRTASAATKGTGTKGSASRAREHVTARGTHSANSTKALKSPGQAPKGESTTQTDPTQTTATEQATPTESTTTAETEAATPVEAAKTTEAQTPSDSTTESGSSSAESSTVVSGGS